MHNPHQSISLKLAITWMIATTLCWVTPSHAETADPGIIINTSGTVSPEVQQAINSVYLAAQEADMIDATATTKLQTTVNSDGTTSQPVKSTRDPISQMIAFSLGAGAGMLIVNYLGGSATIGSFNAFSAITFGGMMGDYVYRKHYAPPLPSIPSSIAKRIAP